MRNEFIEVVVEFDDELMVIYFEGEEVLVELLKCVIRKGVLVVEFFLVVVGLSFKNKGVRKVLDVVIDYLFLLFDILLVFGYILEGVEVYCYVDDEELFIVLVFKVMIDLFVGKLIFFRVYLGKIKSGLYV